MINTQLYIAKKRKKVVVIADADVECAGHMHSNIAPHTTTLSLLPLFVPPIFLFLFYFFLLAPFFGALSLHSAGLIGLPIFILRFEAIFLRKVVVDLMLGVGSYMQFL